MISGSDEVRIRRGDCPPVSVFRVDPLAATPNALGVPICRIFGEYRAGNYSMLGGVIGRIGVSRDGSQVAFEVTDDFSVLSTQQVPPDLEGIYLVGADGTGLRRLGPASRDHSLRFALDPRSPTGILPSVDYVLHFSPDGRRILFTDRVAGPAGDAVQVVTLELESGRRTEVTHLPPVVLPAGVRETGYARFSDNDTVLFATYADADGAHPGAKSRDNYRVNIDGTGLRAIPTPVVLPRSRVVPSFEIATGVGNVVNLPLPDIAVNPLSFAPFAWEVFLLDGKKLLQLTSLGRRDTRGEVLSVDRSRVFLRASADPLGTNPSENCQLFSVDKLGGDLRQITRFGTGAEARSTWGCDFGPPPGCAMSLFIQDPVTRTFVFYSSCDPFGRNPNGAQLFAMRPDGSGLRQLTDARGLAIEADGAVDTELPGPSWYSGRGH
jgi:hypothetical protein